MRDFLQLIQVRYAQKNLHDDMHQVDLYLHITLLIYIYLISSAFSTPTYAVLLPEHSKNNNLFFLFLCAVHS